jgi:hypothetical protein
MRSITSLNVSFYSMQFLLLSYGYLATTSDIELNNGSFKHAFVKFIKFTALFVCLNELNI